MYNDEITKQVNEINMESLTNFDQLATIIKKFRGLVLGVKGLPV